VPGDRHLHRLQRTGDRAEAARRRQAHLLRRQPVAERYWREAGLAGRIQLRLGPALATLAELEREYPPGSFDFVFIDADKEPYERYYEAALRLLRQGGLVLLDNVLWSGRVADPARNDPDTAALKALNRKIHEDARVTLSLLPLGDGLTIARKR
jgi:predicted O-methyltransferase YrrM